MRAIPRDEILDLLSTTRTFGVGRAERVVDLFGGTDALLERIHLEKSWTMRPVLRNEPEGLAVVSDVRYVDPVVQGEPNDILVTHCDHLIAAAPFADLAVSTLVGWDGRPACLPISPWQQSASRARTFRRPCRSRGTGQS